MSPVEQSLKGRRIVVTRARHQASTLSDALHALGAEVIELPVIEIVPPHSYARLDEALKTAGSYHWLLFTSANAVRVFGERLKAIGVAPAILASTKIAAIGPATAAALDSLGMTVNLVPESYVAEALVRNFADDLNGVRVLLIRARVARDVIPDTLRDRGAIVDVVDAYETVLPKDSAMMLPELLASVIDAVTFTSSSTVKNFIALLRQCGLDKPPQLRAISIGPITSGTLRESGWEPFAEATQSDVPGLIDATVRALTAIS
jgi:uroporphyrinogen-III synthase